jgi:hypothetical protein
VGLGWFFMATGSSYGSGFALYEAGARSSALAGAVVNSQATGVLPSDY